MIKYCCEECNNICSTNNLSRTIDRKKHYLLCKTCIKNQKICSKSRCKKLFILDDKDLKNLKYIYIDNPKNKNKFYIYSNIEKIALQKYGDFKSLKKLIEQKKYQKNKKNNERRKEIIQRKNELNDALRMNKLEYKNYGDCFSFVYYGDPSIETVIENELKKLDCKSARKIKLAEQLLKLNIPLDETLPSCYNYINNIGCKNLYQTIRAIEVEYFFKYKTDYIKLLNTYSPHQAKDIALQKYILKTKNEKNISQHFASKEIRSSTPPTKLERLLSKRKLTESYNSLNCGSRLGPPNSKDTRLEIKDFLPKKISKNVSNKIILKFD